MCWQAPSTAAARLWLLTPFSTVSRPSFGSSDHVARVSRARRRQANAASCACLLVPRRAWPRLLPCPSWSAPSCAGGAASTTSTTTCLAPSLRQRLAARMCSRSSDTLNKVADFLQPNCLQGCYKSVPHQYNETYFSALNEDPKQYLLARAIQFFTPGVPMVYYVGLLAGADDIELMEQGSIRDINRHYFSLEEANCCLKRPVVQALIELCRFRNSHPAFQGRVFVDDATEPHELHVRWYSGSSHMAVLWADLETHEFSITHTPYPVEAALEAPASSAADAAVDAAAPTAAAGAIASAFGAAVGDGAAAAAGVGTDDMASVFSIDALDEESRAAVRKQMADAALQELDSDGYNEKIKWSGSAAEAEELFSDMLGAADSVEFLEARKEARRMPESAGAGQADGRDGGASGRDGSSSNGNGANGNGANGGATNGRNGSGSKGSRVAKQARVPVAAGVAAGAEGMQGYREVLKASAGRYDAYNTSASETDEGSASEAEEAAPAAAAAAGAASPSDVAVGDAVEAAGVKGDGNGREKHSVLEKLDLSFGWRQPDERCEAASGG
ncbi:hypothetical protein COO60DRAFT_372189 [Scenedesmus sp. NREL 46B-D3]|nr:hypothetical protein COO60DRAFT_372189 [Scenedesmus sp. NREL 46B-D3]